MGLAGACARQGAPPGGPIDRRPPVVISTVPDTFSVDTAFSGPVRFDFDERISERTSSGTMDQAVVVSPQTGEVKVSHARSGIEVKLDGGFKRGLVYRVTLLPVIRDMFNNRMHDPFELVFSTGGRFVNSAVVGMVWDRITGKPMKDMEVTAVTEADSTTPYVARSDTGGIYVFRYLPPGSYHLVAFEDRNHNGKVDPTEAFGTQTVTLAGADTVLPLDVAALTPDTMPAHVKNAIALDSVTVLVSLDHYLDPQEPDSAIRVSLRSDSAPGTPAPGVKRLYKEYDYSKWVAEYRDSVTLADSIARAKAAEARRASPDTAARDTASRDTSAAPPDTVPPARPAGAGLAPKLDLPPILPGGSVAPPRGARAGGKDTGLGPDGKPLPKQRIVVVLDSGLVPGLPYTVEVRGATTVNGVPMTDQGDTARVVLKATQDTAKAAGDTAGAKAKGDTSVVKDTTVKPDTSRRPRGKAGVRTPPDTGSMPPYFTLATSAALPGRGGGR